MTWEWNDLIPSDAPLTGYRVWFDGSPDSQVVPTSSFSAFFERDGGTHFLRVVAEDSNGLHSEPLDMTCPAGWPDPTMYLWKGDYIEVDGHHANKLMATVQWVAPGEYTFELETNHVETSNWTYSLGRDAREVYAWWLSGYAGRTIRLTALGAGLGGSDLTAYVVW